MYTKKIAMFGLRGEMSELLVAEALERGYWVTAIMCDEAGLRLKHPNLIVLKGEPGKKDDVSKYAKEHDVVIAFHEPRKENQYEHLEVARMYIEGVKKAGVPNLITVGHVFNSQQSYGNYKPIVQAQKDVLNLFTNERELKWSYLHDIQAQSGQGKGNYHISNDIICSHLQGEYKVQPKDLIEAVLDEVEKRTISSQTRGK